MSEEDEFIEIARMTEGVTIGISEAKMLLGARERAGRELTAKEVDLVIKGMCPSYRTPAEVSYGFNFVLVPPVKLEKGQSLFYHLDPVTGLPDPNRMVIIEEDGDYRRRIKG